MSHTFFIIEPWFADLELVSSLTFLLKDVIFGEINTVFPVISIWKWYQNLVKDYFHKRFLEYFHFHVKISKMENSRLFSFKYFLWETRHFDGFFRKMCLEFWSKIFWSNKKSAKSFPELFWEDSFQLLPILLVSRGKGGNVLGFGSKSIKKN